MVFIVMVGNTEGPCNVMEGDTFEGVRHQQDKRHKDLQCIGTVAMAEVISTVNDKQLQVDKEVNCTD